MKISEFENLLVSKSKQVSIPTCAHADVRHAQSLMNAYLAGIILQPEMVVVKVYGSERVIPVAAIQKKTDQQTYLVVSDMPGILLDPTHRIQRPLIIKPRGDFNEEALLKASFDRYLGINQYKPEWFLLGLMKLLPAVIDPKYPVDLDSLAEIMREYAKYQG